MRHPSEGDLRALATGGEDATVREHVRGCARCEALLTRISRAAGLAHARLEGLGGGVATSAPAADPARALQRFKARQKLERDLGMTEFGKKRSLRPALAGGALVAALLAALLISPVRSAAIGLLDVFRVEKFAVITVDPSKLPVRMGEGVEGAHGHGRPDVNAFGTYDGPMKPEKAQEVASLDEAEAVVGYAPAAAPGTLGGESLSKTYVTKPFRASYTFDTDEIRARLDAAGAKSIRVPQQLDGKTFTLTAGRGVAMLYGTERKGVLFAQGPSPELAIPEGVDMDYLRQDFLMIPGLPADLVAQVKEIDDWKHTLVIPVPANGSHKDVKIDGNEGVLISDAKGEHNLVLWRRDDRLYAIGGDIGAADALAAARSVQYR